MATKTARVYTPDELKEKCQKALADLKLVEVVKTAPLNKDGKVNLSWVYKEAEKYVHEQTKDLQKTKELAVATRFLAMLRRDYAEEFKKLVVQEKQLESKAEPIRETFKDLRDCMIEFLEEKFGLRVKICGNCKYFSNVQYKNCSHLPPNIMTPCGQCDHPSGKIHAFHNALNENWECEDWTPKEPPAK